MSSPHARSGSDLRHISGGSRVPFTIALLSGDVDSAEQAIFMVPRIDDGLHDEDVDTSPVLLWIHPTVTGSLDGVPIPVPVGDPECQGREYGFCSDARATPYIVPVVPEMKETSESFIDPFPFEKNPI
jgi:hypothetical protein